MKKWIILLIATLGLAAPANGQMFGLPVADSAIPLESGMMRASGGIIIGDNLNMIGGRFTYGYMDGLAIFGDIGIVDPDRGDAGAGIQAGALYSIPIPDLPFDVAARGTLGYTRFDQRYSYDDWTGERRRRTYSFDFITTNVGGVASLDVEMLTVYGYLGLNYTRLSNGGSDSEIDPALGTGVIYELNEQVSFYGELMHIDDFWIGLGARFSF